MDILTLALAKKYAGGLTQAEVEKIVTDEVAKIVADAPEDFDTLKEMSDWISQHEESAAAMNSAIADNTSAIDTNKTNISTLAKHINGDLLDSDFQEDNTAVMTKTVPAGMGSYAGIKAIGGRTQKKNLFDIDEFVKTNSSKVSKTNDYTFSITGVWYLTQNITLKANTAYTLSVTVVSSTVQAAVSVIDSAGNSVMSESLKGTGSVTFNTTSGTTYGLKIYSGNDTSGTSVYSKLQLEEGSTATQYAPFGLINAPVESVVSIYGKNFFPKKSVELSYSKEIATGLHIPAGDYVFSAIGSSTITINVTFKYVDGTSKMVSLGIESAKRTAVAVTLTSTVVSISTYVNGNVTINDVQLEKGKVMTAYEPYHETTLLLPDSDRNLPCFGYGISDTLQNIRDYENGTYTQMVAEVDLGDCDYTYYSATGVFFTDSVTKKANGMSNLICGSLDAATSGDKIIYGNTSSARVHIKDTTKGTTDATAFKEAMKGIKLVYELATPVVTDCSDILHPIRCESGGTLTFTNEHSLDMPNSIVYKKEVSLNG